MTHGWITRVAGHWHSSTSNLNLKCGRLEVRQVTHWHITSPLPPATSLYFTD